MCVIQLTSQILILASFLEDNFLNGPPMRDEGETNCCANMTFLKNDLFGIGKFTNLSIWRGFKGILQRLAASFDSLQYWLYHTMKVSLPSVVPGPHFPGFFVKKISPRDVKWWILCHQRKNWRGLEENMQVWAEQISDWQSTYQSWPNKVQNLQKNLLVCTKVPLFLLFLKLAER